MRSLSDSVFLHCRQQIKITLAESLLHRSRCNISKLQKYIATTPATRVSYKPESPELEQRQSIWQRQHRSCQKEREKERDGRIVSGHGPKQGSGSVDIEKQIESERCHKRWISDCTCLVLPQILSTNSLPTSCLSAFSFPLSDFINLFSCRFVFSIGQLSRQGTRSYDTRCLMHPGCRCIDRA